ncbi:MAG: hypothetical protein K2X38_04660 [Gemmataceae bacterium]|nr:hypothetical protein [Gemmataceae bacterium]
MAQPKIDPTQVPGWGVDADPKNDPTYPMKRRNDGEHAGYSWDRPTQQPATVEILHSNERPNLSAVFGTASPPVALSGMIRRLAFKYSESSYAHWLPLMLADRINEVEGVVHDLSQGRVPNFFAERGGKAQWKHSPDRMLGRLLIGAFVVSAAVGYFTAPKSEEDLDQMEDDSSRSVTSRCPRNVHHAVAHFQE